MSGFSSSHPQKGDQASDLQRQTSALGGDSGRGLGRFRLEADSAPAPSEDSRAPERGVGSGLLALCRGVTDPVCWRPKGFLDGVSVVLL